MQRGVNDILYRQVFTDSFFSLQTRHIFSWLLLPYKV